ncbi:MAG: class I SAM-dependent RNA methyltransferase, partial [Erythrobacter sp.]|nr:class I SAM-dependent RNA methyltransferase [Erythrobacter sp.]
HVVDMLRSELVDFGYEPQGEDKVSVAVGASLVAALQLTLQLRTAQQVLWQLDKTRCTSQKMLEKWARSFPWEELIPNDAYLSISSNVSHPSVTNTMYPNLLLKDAIVDRIKQHTGERPDSGPDRTGVVIYLVWKGDRAWLYLNVNGTRLSDRGYRRIPHHAPMSETLAAAVLIGAGFDGSQTLLNPMCGSGTIAIEAALMMAGRAPGLMRNDASALHTLLEIDDEYINMRKRLRKSTPVCDPPKPIIASDHDPSAIDAARRNAKTAGVDHLIEFMCCDFRDSYVPELREGEHGHVILNPEYGIRLGETEELRQDYRDIGFFFKDKCSGYTGHVFTGSRSLSTQIRLRAKSKLPFNNSNIPCRLLSYELYRPEQAAAPDS